MAYPYFNPYYPQPMPDNLMQMRQMQQPQMQPMQQPMSQPVQQNPIAQSGVQWVNGEQEARGLSHRAQLRCGAVGFYRADCVSQAGGCKREADAQDLRPCRARRDAPYISAGKGHGICHP